MEAHAATADSSPAIALTHAAEKPLRVLIVDDDPGIRLLWSINLELEGIVVLEAADGRTGLAQARSKRPDLVLSDVRMPGLDGFQLAEAMRRDERTREVPLILISAESGPANEARASELGALAYLTKPYDPTALVALVAGVLGRAVKPPLLVNPELAGT